MVKFFTLIKKATSSFPALITAIISMITVLVSVTTPLFIAAILLDTKVAVWSYYLFFVDSHSQRSTMAGWIVFITGIIKSIAARNTTMAAIIIANTPFIISFTTTTVKSILMGLIMLDYHYLIAIPEVKHRYSPAVCWLPLYRSAWRGLSSACH